MHIMRDAMKFQKRVCVKCKRADICFQGGMFWLEAIEQCDKAPEVFKRFYRLKEEGIIEMEHPFKINLKKMEEKMATIQRKKLIR